MPLAAPQTWFDDTRDSACWRTLCPSRNLRQQPRFDGTIHPETQDIDQLMAWCSTTTVPARPVPRRCRPDDQQQVYHLFPLPDFLLGLPSLAQDHIRPNRLVQPTRGASGTDALSWYHSLELVVNWDTWYVTRPSRCPLPARTRQIEQPFVPPAAPQTAWSLLAAPSLDVPTLSAGGTLAASTTYFYVVTTLTVAGESVSSNERSIATTLLDLTVNLTWTAVTDSTHYKVYRGTSSGANNTLIADTTSTSYTDTGTSIGTFSPPTTNTAGVNTNWELSVWHWINNPQQPTILRRPRSQQSELFTFVPLVYESLLFSWHTESTPAPRGVRGVREQPSAEPPLAFEIDATRWLSWQATFAASRPLPTARRPMDTTGHPVLPPSSDVAILGAWNSVVVNPLPYRLRVPTNRMPVADTTEHFGALTTDVLLAWAGQTTQHPRRLPPALPGGMSLGELPQLGETLYMTWYSQPQRPIPAPRMRPGQVFEVEPTWFISGATISVLGPYWVAAGQIYVSGAVVGQLNVE